MKFVNEGGVTNVQEGNNGVKKDEVLLLSYRRLHVLLIFHGLVPIMERYSLVQEHH